VNPNSPAQVVEYLLLLGVTTKEITNKGKITTEHSVLEKLLQTTNKQKAKDFIESLFEYRNLKKISGTYLGPLSKRAKDNNGIVCCTINPTDSRTGRPASRNPNLLNIPEPKIRSTKKTNPVRECFVPREGFANYYFDYEQMEMAIFGLMAGDQRIVKGYKEGEDLHDYMARIVWKDKYNEDPKFWRGVTKNINFGIIYGMGIRKMALTYGMSESDAKKYYKIYMQEFPKAKKFQEECERLLKKYGYVEDDFERRYSIPVGQAYKAVNALVQGSCAQIFKIALLKVQKYLDVLPKRRVYESHILLTVYDEVQMESRIWRHQKHEKDLCREVARQMTDIPQLNRVGFKLMLRKVLRIGQRNLKWSCSND
jgi:DNA polymerase-1